MSKSRPGRRRKPTVPADGDASAARPKPTPGLVSAMRTAWRAAPKTKRNELIASHVLLFAGFAWAGATYLEFQLLIAAELVLTNLASIPLYPGRGWRRHAADVAKLIPGMAFIMFFVLVTYGVVLAKDGEPAIPAVLAVWERIDAQALAAFTAWIVFHHGSALWRAWRDPNPRLFWTRARLLEAGATFVAFFAMVFATFFIALPVTWVIRSVGAEAPVDLLLIAMMVLARLGGCLLLATMPDSELKSMADNPYL